MSFQMSAGLDASRVVSANPRPESAEPFVADRVADHLHERAGGQLRKVAEKRQQPIVRVDADDARLRAKRAHEGHQLLERGARPIAGRREEPWTPAEQIGSSRAPGRPSPRRQADGRRQT